MPRLQLTDRFVAGAKATGAPQVDFFDAGTPGLALRVSAGGAKAWTYLFTSPRDGKRARVKLGRYPSMSLAAARTRANEAAREVDEGKDPRDVLAAQEVSAVTVATLAGNYVQMHVRPNLRSAVEYEARLNRHILPVIGSVRLADLHARDINRVIDPILKRGKMIEANRNFQSLRAMLRWAVRRGDLDRSPMEGMAKPAPDSTPRERVLAETEIRQFWTMLPAALARSKTAQRILKLALVTGQRVGEVAGMTRAEVDFEKALWSIPGARTKNGSPHVVPLPLTALEIIREGIAYAGKRATFIFPAGEGSIDPHVIATTLRRAHTPTKEHPIGRFEMPAFTAHDLRRTCLTGLAELGVQPIVIGAIANHLSVTKANVTFINYIRHDYGREKRAALDLWAERVAAIVEGGRAEIVALRGRRS